MMGGLSVGPLAFSADRAPVIAGLLVLLITTGLLARRAGPGLSGWATTSVLVAAVAARLGFVFAHAAAFRADPLSVLAIWQGGFSPLWGAVGFAAVTVWSLIRDRALTAPAAVALLLAGMAWNVVDRLAAGGGIALPEDVALADLNGSPISLDDWRGKPMVINLWASWCPPCRREMPMMADVAQAEAEVALHFINQGEGPAAIRDFLSRSGVRIAPWLDHGMQMMRHFNAQGLPATLFIDANGRLHSAHLGEISRPALLAGIADLKETP